MLTQILKKMKSLSRLLIISVILFASFTNTKGQDLLHEKPLAFRKNIVHTSVGFLVLYIPGTIFYERILSQPKENREIATFIRAGYGAYPNWSFVQEYMVLEVGFFLGSEASHIEFAVGGMKIVNNSILMQYQPAASMGYRFQRPGGRIMFRSGIGYPEAIYVGVGFCF